MKNRNKIIIFIVIAGCICFCFMFMSYPYVKIKVVYDSSLIKNETRKIRLTYTENNKNYYYNNKNGIVVTGDKADYGEYILTIPINVKNDEKSKQLKIRYMKYNNWYKSKINVNLEIRKQNKKEYLFVKTSLIEGGRFQKDKRSINKKFLLNSNKFEMDLEE